MDSHSFNVKNVTQYADKTLSSLTFFDPKQDDLCKMKDGSIKMNSSGIQEIFDKDINRSALLYIETAQGVTDLVQEAKDKHGVDHVNYDKIHDLLTNKYKLSTNQAEYVLAAAHQGSIAGGLAGFAPLIAANVTDINKFTNRNGNASKILIDKNNNVSYIGGQKLIFDCNSTDYDGTIRHTIHTNFKSEDYLAVTISADLGQLSKSQLKPEVVIEAVGEGVIGTKIIQELQKIETNIPTLPAETTLSKYHDFSNSIMEHNGQNKLYKQEVTAEVENILSLDPKQIDQESVKNLKKLNFVQEALAESVLTKIDKQLNSFKEKGQNVTFNDKNVIANDMATGLAKFVDLPKGYVERFSKDL